MARTKENENLKLARVAHCMDNYLREKNSKLEQRIINLHQYYRSSMANLRKELTEQLEAWQEREREAWTIVLEDTQRDYIDMIMSRDNRIRELEGSWEDMANTLHDTMEENLRMKARMERMEEQLLDQTDHEDLTSQ